MRARPSPNGTRPIRQATSEMRIYHRQNTPGEWRRTCIRSDHSTHFALSSAISRWNHAPHGTVCRGCACWTATLIMSDAYPCRDGGYKPMCWLSWLSWLFKQFATRPDPSLSTHVCVPTSLINQAESHYRILLITHRERRTDGQGRGTPRALRCYAWTRRPSGWGTRRGGRQRPAVSRAPRGRTAPSTT